MFNMFFGSNEKKNKIGGFIEECDLCGQDNCDCKNRCDTCHRIGCDCADKQAFNDRYKKEEKQFNIEKSKLEKNKQNLEDQKSSLKYDSDSLFYSSLLADLEGEPKEEILKKEKKLKNRREVLKSEEKKLKNEEKKLKSSKQFIKSSDHNYDAVTTFFQRGFFKSINNNYFDKKLHESIFPEISQEAAKVAKNRNQEDLPELKIKKKFKINKNYF